MDGFLGIDISKEFLDSKLSVGASGDELVLPRVTRDRAGLRQLFREVKVLGITKLHICMEATGSYWNDVALFFHKIKGASVYVVNPARIKAQRRTEQKRSKNDAIDAGVILRFLKGNLALLSPWHPPSPAVSQLQDLVRFRDLLVRQRASLKTYRKSKDGVPIVACLSTRQIEELDNAIDELEKQIGSVVDRDSVLAAQKELAESVDGIGPVASAVLLSECRAFEEIKDPRQATAFAGLDVVEVSSGTIKKPSHISHQGSGLLRKTFVCISAAAIRRPGRFRDFYLRLRQRGIKTKPALVAVARKLLEVTVAVVLSGRAFDPQLNRQLAGNVANSLATG